MKTCLRKGNFSQISGFGLDETSKLTQKLNFARLPVTQNQICNYALGKELTSVEFCAGYSTGSHNTIIDLSYL